MPSPDYEWRRNENVRELFSSNGLAKHRCLSKMKGQNMKKNDILGRKSDVVSMEPLLIDVKEVARLLNVCERTVRTLTKNGELPVVKLASRVLYSIKDLIEFVRQKSTRESVGNHEQIDFAPSTPFAVMHSPVEWFIPHRATSDIIHWNNPNWASGHGR